MVSFAKKLPFFSLVLAALSAAIFMMRPAGGAVSFSAGQERSYNIFLVDFAGQSGSRPWTRQEFEGRMFLGPDSLDAFFKENSYGKTGLVGKVYGWYTLPISQTCDTDAVLEETLKIAENEPGYSAGSNTYTVIVAPFGPGYCGWVGYYLGYKKYVAATTANHNYMVTLAHEIGHTMGMLHASFYNCGRDLKADSESCIIEEYGDLYDVMGSSMARFVHFNAIHKEFMGWFEPENIAVATTSGRYVLQPMSALGPGVKALKIPRTGSSHLYLEYRQPIGFDRNLEENDSSLFNGALLHVSEGQPAKSFLINPASSREVRDPALLVGNSYRDPLTGTSVSVVSKSFSGLYVDVVVGGTAVSAETAKAGRFPTGSVVLDDKTAFLIVGQEKIGFSSQEAFLGLGYSWQNAISGNTNAYRTALRPPISSAAEGYPSGSWSLLGRTVYYRHESGFIPVPSWSVFVANGGKKESIAVMGSQGGAMLKDSPLLQPLREADSRIYR